MAIGLTLKVPLSWIRDEVGEVPESGIIKVPIGNTVWVEDESGKGHPIPWETINTRYEMRLVKDYED